MTDEVEIVVNGMASSCDINDYGQREIALEAFLQANKLPFTIEVREKVTPIALPFSAVDFEHLTKARKKLDLGEDGGWIVDRLLATIKKSDE